MMLPVHVGDPMSGFFALKRDLFVRTAPRLSGQGFKILMDIILSAPENYGLRKSPARFIPVMQVKASLMLSCCFSLSGLFLKSCFAAGCHCGLSASQRSALRASA